MMVEIIGEIGNRASERVVRAAIEGLMGLLLYHSFMWFVV